tara:strand:+ start:1203 stop:1424 length:222 start_codon:yes stop_codon:yes gene_type:complete
MLVLNFNIMTEEEVMAIDFAIYEQLVRLIRAQHCQQSAKAKQQIDILQNLRLKIAKWQHKYCQSKQAWFGKGF